MKQVLAKNGLPRIQGFPGTWIQDNYETMTNLAMAQQLGISLRMLEKRLMRMRHEGYLPAGPKKRIVATKASSANVGTKVGAKAGKARKPSRSPVVTVNVPDVSAVTKYIEKTLGQESKSAPGSSDEVRVRDSQGRVMGFSADSSSIVDGMLHLWVERDGYQPYIVATWAPGAWAQVWTVEARAS